MWREEEVKLSPYLGLLHLSAFNYSFDLPTLIIYNITINNNNMEVNMNLLQMALKAELPLISITTEDTLNIKEILSYYVGTAITEITDNKTLAATKNKYCITYDDPSKDIRELYTTLVNSERTLIFVNPTDNDPLVFSAGELPTPPGLVKRHLLSVVSEEDMEKLFPSFGGMSLKEITEVARLAMATDGCLTPRGVMSIRRQLLTRSKGIQQVDTDIPFYDPSLTIDTWLDTNTSIFLLCDDQRLIPRGLLLRGEPGTGKTQAAKYIATRLQVPLYLTNLGSMLGKYVGDSESNLRVALSQIDREEPCVLLLDEVEKVFKTSEDSGVVARLLAHLLWWLQEHKSRCLTIMTTNDLSALPHELYRPGRIDTVIHMKPLTYQEAGKFAVKVIRSFNVCKDIDTSTGNHIVDTVLSAVKSSEEKELSHAAITQIVIGFIKDMIKTPFDKTKKLY